VVRSLRKVLLRELVLLLGAVVALVVVLAWIGMTRIAKAQTRARSTSALQQLDRSLTQRFGELERLTNAIAALWANGTIDPIRDQTCFDTLLPLMEGRPMVTGLDLARTDGRAFGMGHLASGWGGRSILRQGDGWVSGPVLGDPGNEFRANASLVSRARDFRERPWYQAGAASAQGRWIDPYPFVGRHAGTPGLSYVVPVRDRAGTLLGVVALDVILEDLTSVVHETLPTPNALVMVLDAEGRLVVPPLADGFREPAQRQQAFLRPVGPDLLPLAYALHQSGPQAGGQLEGAYFGNLLPFHGGSGLKWELMIGVPQSDVLTDPYRRALAVGLFGALLTALLAWQGVRLGRRFTVPLGQLEAEAARLGGKEALQLPTTDIREIRHLSEALARAHGAVAEREALQDQLRQSQKLEMVGTLAGGIAHDVNNQLTAIHGQIELGLEKIGEAHAAERNLQAAAEATRRCGETTKALLAFSRPSNPELKPLDLNAAVREGMLLLERVIDRRIHLEANLGEGLLPVLGDQVQVEQVLVNLVVNARDALPAGGTIQVATGFARGEIMLEVRDNGVGMTPDVKARIFEPFFTTKEMGKGTGLGLSMVHGIVAAHGGHLEVESEWGRGTTVRVMLRPAAGALAEQAQARTAQVARFEGARILIVEDEQSIRGTMAELLEVRGARVVTAVDGMEGWERLQQESFDLVLSDQLMPRMTGLELLARIREVWPTLPVILASGRGLEGLESELTRDANLRLLPKPFPLARLMALVAEGLNPR
jgi:signal transduction histidine kinase